MAWIFVQVSPFMASDPGAVVSVELVPATLGRSVPKPGPDPETKMQARHADAGRERGRAQAHKRPAPATPVLAEAGRQAPVVPSHPRQADLEASSVPEHASASAPATVSRQNLDLVRRHLERFKFYPESARRRGIGGDVEVGFRLTSGGRAAQVRVLASSGYDLLDEAALQTVSRAQPFPVGDGQYRFRLRFHNL